LKLSHGDTKIGGAGCIVEIDESLIAGRKNNAERILPQQWCLVAYIVRTISALL